MSDNHHKIKRLKQLIVDTLLPLIDDDYALLDAPNHSNIGDSLIYEGELEFLKLSPHKKKFASSIKFLRLDHLPANGILLFHGGGNFGDLWPRFQKLRARVIASRKHQKIIIFPQTVFYQHKENLMADAAVFNAHPDLTICARDENSYAILKRYFTHNKIIQLPDMAFCLDLKDYHQNEGGGKILILKRTDQEIKKDMPDMKEILQPEDRNKIVEVADWPGFELSHWQQRMNKWKERENKYTTRLMRDLSIGRKRIDLNFGVRKLYQSKDQMEKGIAFINQYDTIYSTRLHGAILAILLNKRVYIIDNSYGKNNSFYQSWLSEFENCSMR